VSGAEAYLYVKFHFDTFNRLAAVHERYRQTGERYDSIGRTVLQMVAQKLLDFNAEITTVIE